MRVEVQLHATLVPYLPRESRDGLAVIDLADGASVGDLIRRLAIPPELSRVVLVNGHDVEDDTRLSPGDTVDVFPPLAGGSGAARGRAGAGWYTPKALGSV